MDPMTRRRFLECAGLLGVGGGLGLRQIADAAQEKGLNVLFMMTDEQHYRSLSLTGNSYIETPNMDRIGKEGVLFTQYTCVTPYCSPSRASLITGVYPHTHGILYNVSPNRNTQKALSPGAFPNTECILHEEGYSLGHRGKWHLGDKGTFPCYQSYAYAARTNAEYSKYLAEHCPAPKESPYDPGRYLGRPVEKIPAIREGWQAFHDLPKNGVAYIATIGRTVIPPEHLPETQITNEVLDLLDKHADEPFMITASWSPPHDLWVVPEPYYSMVDRNSIEIPGSRDLPPWDSQRPTKKLGDIMGDAGIREYMAVYHGMVKYIDDQVGRVLRKLDELGLAERTLVLFTTDHGDMVGAHGCIGKSISSFFDDLVRIPLVMRLPGAIEPGTVVDAPVSQIDVMPTILDYLGLQAPGEIHGRSMRPLVEGRSVDWREYAFCQRANQLRMIRTHSHKYAFGLRPRMLALYDLEKDPHENDNLGNDSRYASAVKKMHGLLLQVMERDKDPLLSEFPKDPLSLDP